MTSLPVAGGEADAFCLLCFSYGIVSPGRSNVNIFFDKFLYILPGSWHTKGVHSKEKEVLSMAKNNQNKNQNQNQNQNQNKNQNQEQSKQAKECN